MKYKVGDKVFVQNYMWEITEIFGETYEGSAVVNKNLISTFNDKHIESSENKKLNHDQTILHLNELNALKTRQLDELMKFIAHLVPKAHKEYLSHHLNDVQLIDGIIYHVRKGK